jgi:hypothetical protein
VNFAASAWLWSGLALAVPIALHLLGRGRGARRLWPSVRLLRETGLASGARWRPSQPWLLLWRCALLGTVTLALAEPWIAPRVRSGTLWLVEPGGEGAEAVQGRQMPGREAGPGEEAVRGRRMPGREAGPARARPESGEEAVRYLAPGLPSSIPAATAAPSGAPDLWSLLAEADAVSPPGLDFKVLARPRLGALRGSRPALGRAVAWYAPGAAAIDAAPGVAMSGSAGGAGSGGSVASDGSTGPAGSAGPVGSGGPAVSGGPTGPAGSAGGAGSGGSAASDGSTGPAGPASSAVSALAPPRRVRLRLLIAAAPGRAADAAALRAGLGRGAEALGWTIEDAAGAPAAGLLASLGQEPPAGWAVRVERGATLLRDEMEELHACASLVATRCCGGFERWQCGGEASGQALWRDGAGRAVLARSALGRGAILRFAGRFAPGGAGWSSGAFAALLREAFGDPFAAAAETSIAQALPERRPALGASDPDWGAGVAPAGSSTAESLTAIFWLLAGSCFAAERWLVWRAAEARRSGWGNPGAMRR